jgi:hypothetical protein
VFRLDWDSLDKHGEFNIDWRLTKKPEMREGKHLDFEVWADIGDGPNNRCALPAGGLQQDIANFGVDYFYLVADERVFNCMLLAMEKQGFFEYKLNSAWMLDQLGTNRV